MEGRGWDGWVREKRERERELKRGRGREGGEHREQQRKREALASADTFFLPDSNRIRCTAFMAIVCGPNASAERSENGSLTPKIFCPRKHGFRDTAGCLTVFARFLASLYRVAFTAIVRGPNASAELSGMGRKSLKT